MNHHNRTDGKFVSAIKSFRFFIDTDFHAKPVAGNIRPRENRTAGKGCPAKFYMNEIMILPNSDVETSRASLIRRAKSLVTCLDEMAFCMEAMTRSAASVQPI